MRLLIVSNRLPITVQDASTLKIQESVGGLASGLKAYLDLAKKDPDFDYLWIGWPGITAKGRMREQLKSMLITEFKAYPVSLPEKAMEKFYHGFCNRTIWPLFHYFPTLTIYDEGFWNNYNEVNEEFCNEILKILNPGDMVWIHDYHLMLLPKMLREKAPKTAIGFFLHIPFPSYEVFRLLPSKWRKEILEGMLGADLIGFHTYDYAQYFARCVLRIAGYDHNMSNIKVGNRLVKADTFPMGIDFNKFNSAADTPEVARKIEDIKKPLHGCKIILSIDRLDYTKGILNRLRGYEIFLKRFPEWHGKIALIVVVVPSRVKVEHYSQMKKQIDELVGKINGRFGCVNWSPILYVYRYIPFYELIALYRTSDIALVTPLRDGMNLIAKEYIATKTDEMGVLILSEMAGASKALGEAVIINPNNVQEIADAIEGALKMPEEEQKRRNRILRARTKSYDILQWAEDFITSTLDIKRVQERCSSEILDPSSCQDLIRNYRNAKKRLLLLDYDGTLVPYSNDPSSVCPGKELLKILEVLSADPRNEIVLISGRDKAFIQKWFGKSSFSMIAEHGAWIKRRSERWIMSKSLSATWKPKVLPIMKRYADRLPGAFVEEKEYSLVWHYRAADQEAASVKVREMIDDLVSYTANIDVHVLRGNKIVEVRNAGINKGIALRPWLFEDYDFILAAGDDTTDEDMFKVMPQFAYTLKIGNSESNAKFKLETQSDILDLLGKLANGEHVPLRSQSCE